MVGADNAPYQEREMRRGGVEVVLNLALSFSLLALVAVAFQ
jgi:hypothetical protein